MTDSHFPLDIVPIILYSPTSDPYRPAVCVKTLDFLHKDRLTA